MHTLAIDIETYSSNDLIKCGVYKYVEAPDFEVLLIAYKFDNEEVRIKERGQKIDNTFLYALTNPLYVKTAFNANFERVCLSKFFNVELPVEQWECTAVKSSMLGLPLNLDGVAKALKLQDEKDKEGKALIRYFSLPCKPTKANGGRTRNLPEHAPEKWEKFKDYCKQDVVVEQAIRDKISFFQIPATEKKLYCLDQKINDKGVLMDLDLINSAVKIDLKHTRKLMDEAVNITGLDNPNSVLQIKNWLLEETGEEVEKLNKNAIPPLIKSIESNKAKRVLEIRQETSKTSIKKYKAMLDMTCEDSRARGLFQFNGANRTGRWSGRKIQPQNLRKNDLKDLDLARRIVREGDGELLEMCFNVPDTLSQLVRTAFVAQEGQILRVADFSAIELIVAAWLAGEQWVIDEYKGERKNYEHTAARMFNIPVEQITKDSPERQKGKIASLACQYGGGAGALTVMDTKNSIAEEEKPRIVSLWRKSNPKIVKMWYDLEAAAIQAVQEGVSAKLKHGIQFVHKYGFLFLKLPSGRFLSYANPIVKTGKFGKDTLFYAGLDQTTKQWKLTDTYGGKLFENLCQSVARDCLAEALINVDEAGYSVVLHVHDEIVAETPENFGSVTELCQIMSRPISWAPGLPLHVEGYETKFYKK